MHHFLNLINDKNTQIYNYNFSAKIMFLKIICCLNIKYYLSNYYCINEK
jgi:hypothetical protein